MSWAVFFKKMVLLKHEKSGVKVKIIKNTTISEQKFNPETIARDTFFPGICTVQYGIYTTSAVK